MADFSFIWSDWALLLLLISLPKHNASEWYWICGLQHLEKVYSHFSFWKQYPATVDKYTGPNVKGGKSHSGERLLIFEHPIKYTPPFSAPEAQPPKFMDTQWTCREKETLSLELAHQLQTVILTTLLQLYLTSQQQHILTNYPTNKSQTLYQWSVAKWMLSTCPPETEQPPHPPSCLLTLRVLSTLGKPHHIMLTCPVCTNTMPPVADCL